MNEQQQPPVDAPAQIQLGGGLIPLPNGTFIGHVWFSGLPNENVARQFMAQLDNVVKTMFTATPNPMPQPQPQPPATNGPAS